MLLVAVHIPKFRPLLGIELTGQVAAGMNAPHDVAGIAPVDIDDAMRMLVNLAGMVLAGFEDQCHSRKTLIGRRQQHVANPFR
jgi:hypothetical protein